MKPKKNKAKAKTIIGWREWVSLPDLGISKIKAKVDTGAKTSSLHAYDIQKIDSDHVSFKVHPVQREEDTEIVCRAKLTDHRKVKSSTGHTQERYVIQTKMLIGETEVLIEVTLTNRSEMGFRMLLGREALSKGFLVDSKKSFLNS